MQGDRWVLDEYLRRAIGLIEANGLNPYKRHLRKTMVLLRMSHPSREDQRFIDQWEQAIRDGDTFDLKNWALGPARLPMKAVSPLPYIVADHPGMAMTVLEVVRHVAPNSTQLPGDRYLRVSPKFGSFLPTAVTAPSMNLTSNLTGSMNSTHTQMLSTASLTGNITVSTGTTSVKIDRSSAGTGTIIVDGVTITLT